MKTTIGLLTWAFSLVTLAQGTIDFINLSNLGQGVNAPVYESDGVTKLSGPQFMAELLAGANAVNLTSIASTGFLQGGGAGYFNGGIEAVPGLPGGADAWVEVRVWNTASGASFAQATASGLPNSWYEWPIFSVQLGDPFQGVPAVLSGLGNSPAYLNSIPEPSTFALAGFGAVVVLWGMRRTGLHSLKPSH